MDDPTPWVFRIPGCRRGQYEDCDCSTTKPGISQRDDLKGTLAGILVDSPRYIEKGRPQEWLYGLGP